MLDLPMPLAFALLDCHLEWRRLTLDEMGRLRPPMGQVMEQLARAWTSVVPVAISDVELDTNPVTMVTGGDPTIAEGAAVMHVRLAVLSEGLEDVALSLCYTDPSQPIT